MMCICQECKKYLKKIDLIDGNCPICGDLPEKICDGDHPCKCSKEVHETINICPVCGENVCPCGCHDIAIISRVTGYMSELSGWNAAKTQEWKDRRRVDLEV